MRFVLFLFCVSSLYAGELGTLSYESTLYYESGKTKVDTIDTGTMLPNLTFDDQTQQFSTFYSILGYELASSDSQWVLNLEGRVALKLHNNNYSNRFYRKLYGNENINQAVLTEASIDYYDTNFALSFGRNRLDLDWLSGSFDSVMAYGVSDFIQMRTFWFINYCDFQYNYYTKYKEINDNKGIGGLYLQNAKARQQMEWAFYYYHVFDKAYLSGIKLQKSLNIFSLNASYSYLGNIGESRLSKESFLRLWSDININDNNGFGFGYSQTGENGLLSMLKFGAHSFSQFYLSNALDRSKAKNFYLKYSYENTLFLFESIAGVTSYRGKSLIRLQQTETKMRSFEVDLNLWYALSENIMLSLGYMLLDLDKKDNLAFDQNLLTLSLSMQLP